MEEKVSINNMVLFRVALYKKNVFNLKCVSITCCVYVFDTFYRFFVWFLFFFSIKQKQKVQALNKKKAQSRAFGERIKKNTKE
jgi:formate/nitrite transporter FocA (FNT family)